MRIRAVLLIGAGVGFLSLSISALIFAGVMDNPVPYETSIFKAEFPAGSKVEQREKTTNARVQHTFEAAVLTSGDAALALFVHRVRILLLRSKLRTARPLDKETLWEKAALGYPMSPEEIERM